MVAEVVQVHAALAGQLGALLDGLGGLNPGPSKGGE